MVFHRHHHGPLHAVRNVGWSRDEQEISTWHAAFHHALLHGYQSTGLPSATLPPERARDPYYLSGAGRTKRLTGWSHRPKGRPSLLRQGLRCSGILKAVRPF